MKRTIFNIIAIAPILVMLYLAFAESHYSGLAVEITSPRDSTTVYAPLIPISGIVSDTAAKVTVNNTPVVVAENGYFVIGVDLAKGRNTITAVAEVEGVGKVKKIVTVIYKTKD
jgi:hypothetical protein